MPAALVLLALGAETDGGVVLVGGDGPLPREEIRKVIHHHQRDVRSCYERELTKNPKLTGKLLVHFVIGPTGKVTGASVEKSELPATLVECVRGIAGKMEFRAPLGGGIVKVTYPFVFSAEPELAR